MPHAVTLLERAFGDALKPDELGLVLELLGKVEASTLELAAAREAARD